MYVYLFVRSVVPSQQFFSYVGAKQMRMIQGYVLELCLSEIEDDFFSTK